MSFSSSVQRLGGSLDEPDYVYYNAEIVNNETRDQTANAPGDPQVRFNETRDAPLVRDASQYHFSIIRFTMNGPSLDLPLFIPIIQTGQPDINRTTYELALPFTQTFTTSNQPLGITFTVLPPVRAIQYASETKNALVAPLPAPPLVKQDISTRYYWVYTIQHWLDLVNTTITAAHNDTYLLFQSQWTAANTGDVFPYPTFESFQADCNTPQMTYNPDDKTFTLIADSRGFGESLVTSGTSIVQWNPTTQYNTGNQVTYASSAGGAPNQWAASKSNQNSAPSLFPPVNNSLVAPYSPTTIYNPGAQVSYLDPTTGLVGNWFCTANNLLGVPPAFGPNWTVYPNWSATVQYGAFSTVFRNGKTWYSLVPAPLKGSQPSSPQWGSATEWSSTVVYPQFSEVTYDGQLWVAGPLATLGTPPAYPIWGPQLVGPVYPLWQPTSTYNQNDLVTLANGTSFDVWYAVTPVVGSLPSAPNWIKVAGAWVGSQTYQPGDIVSFGLGYVFEAKLANAATPPYTGLVAPYVALNTTYWAIVSPNAVVVSTTPDWTNYPAWSPTVVYSTQCTVNYANNVWVSGIPVTGTPPNPANPTQWVIAPYWNSSVTYIQNYTVLYGGIIWAANVVVPAGKVPQLGSLYWRSVIIGPVYPEWDASATYTAGQYVAVTVSPSPLVKDVWMAITPIVASVPATPDWIKIAPSWAPLTSYTPGQTVSFLSVNGNGTAYAAGQSGIYRCKQANSATAPYLFPNPFIGIAQSSFWEIATPYSTTVSTGPLGFRIFFDTNMFGLFANFSNLFWNTFSPTVGPYPGFVAPAGYVTEILVPNKFYTNILDYTIAPYTDYVPVSKQQKYWLVRQEWLSTSQLWSPISSLVFTSTLLPVRPEQTGPPIVLGSSDLSNSAAVSQSAFQPIITDIADDLSVNGTEQYRKFIYYAPTAEYRLGDFGPSHQEIRNIDIQVFWKCRLDSQFYPLQMYNLSSVSIKMMLRHRMMLAKS